ncbi:MAG: AMP-binding protein, partial [Actinomycetota bacterium]
MPSKIAALVDARAQSTEDAGRPAYIDSQSGSVLTWGDVRAAAGRWREAARSAGLAPGTPVALAVSEPLAFIGAYLGLLSAGAVVLTLDPFAMPVSSGAEGDGTGGTGRRDAAALAEAAAALGEFTATGVVTDGAGGRRAAEEAGVPAWGLSVAGPDPGALSAPARGAGDRRPAPWAEPSTVVLRTSGSTGRPKGVPLQERLLLHNASAVVGHHRLGPAERMHSALPLFHINAQVTGVLSALVAGSSLVIADRFHRNGFWDVLGGWEVTVLNAVPAILTLLAEGSPPPDSVRDRVRFARSASAPLPVATLAAFQERCGIGVLETYGMTEAAGQICASPLAPELRRPGSVGLPVGIELQVVDERGRPVPAGEEGAVEIRGPSVTTAYITPAEGGTSPSRRIARKPSGWLATGDVGFADHAGFVVLLGRVDGVINRGGEKVYPREVEEVLLRHGGVAAAAVVGEPDPVLGERPVALIVRKEQIPGDLAAFESDLLALCRRELTRHKQPARIDVVDRLPSTATGKVRRDQLKAMVSGSTPGSPAPAKPAPAKPAPANSNPTPA